MLAAIRPDGSIGGWVMSVAERDHYYGDEVKSDIWTCRWLSNRWVIARVDEPVGKDMKRLYVFGREEGGKTREEALFWLLRAQSKQGIEIVVPPGWEKIEPGLPGEEGDEHA